MTEREYGPQSGLLKRRLLGGGLIVVVLAFIAAAVFLDRPVPQNGEPAPGYFGSNDTAPSPWIFALAAFGFVIAALNVHRLGSQPKDDDE